MQKIFIWLICFMLCAACTHENDHSEIHFAIAQAPLNLDPRQATDAASERVNRLIYQPLYDFDASSNPLPILAAKAEMQGLECRITLKKSRATFHNGAPLNAQDVVATYQSLLGKNTFPHAADFAHVTGIRALDAETIAFQLDAPDAHFLEKLIIGILPKSLIEQGHDFPHNPVGNGALKFVSWQNKLVLQRVKDGQKITLQEVKDPTVRVLKLKKGEVDVLQGDLPPELVVYLKSQPNIRVLTSVGANFSYLGLNMQDPFLRNLKVREALAHAIDRNAIIEKMMVQNTRVAGAILPPEHYAGNKNLPPYDYNPSLAKRLLQEAGIKLPLKLVYKTSTDAQRVRLATIMQAQMQAAGIQLEIRSLDWGTFFADVKAGNFQLYGLTWVGIKTPEIYAKASGSTNFPPNGFNRGRYADAELDKLLADENWPTATQRIHAQLPYIPLWYEGQFAAMRSNIKHYSPKPDGNWDDLATIKP